MKGVGGGSEDTVSNGVACEKCTLDFLANQEGVYTLSKARKLSVLQLNSLTVCHSYRSILDNT